MAKRTLPQQEENTSSNDLVYFLASLCLFIIMALLASESNTFFN